MNGSLMLGGGWCHFYEVKVVPGPEPVPVCIRLPHGSLVEAAKARASEKKV